MFTMLRITTALLLCATSVQASYDPVDGELHPDFVLPDIHTNKNVALSDFHGKKVLILHFASW